MAFVMPISWAVGGTAAPSHTALNQELISNPTSLRALNDAAIRVHRTSTQSIPNDSHAGTANLSWQAQSYQVGMTWSSGSNPTRITVPFTGVYLLAANVKYASNTTGRRGLGWSQNGGATKWDLAVQESNGVDTVNGIELIPLVAGDYIEIYAWQTSGGALSTSGTTLGDCWAHLSLWATGGPTAPLWLPPRTWADAEKIPAALLNSQIRDEVLNLRNFKGVGAKVYLADDQSVSQGDRAAISWDKMLFHVGDFWSGSKFVAPVDGLYLAILNAEWDGAGGSTVIGAGYRINDSHTNHDCQFQQGGGSNTQMVNAADIIFLRKNDFLEWYTYQDGDESLSLHGGNPDQTRASVVLWAASS